MQNITVLLLAAGFGTRLRELTKEQPKALVAVGKKRLIDCALWQLRRAGLSDIIINLHYLGDKIITYLGDGSAHSLRLSYSREDPILDTGGAIKKVLRDHPKRSILVYNCDATFGTDLDLSGFINRSLDDSEKPVASMLLTPRAPHSAYGVVKGVAYRDHLRVTQILENKLPTPCAQPENDFIFTGIQLLAPRALDHMLKLPEIFSSIGDLYPIFINNNSYIRAEPYNGFWLDAGTQESLKILETAVIQNKVGIL